MSDADEEWPTKPGAMFVVTREQLHRHVWQEPMLKLAARLNISGNGLAKTCKAHHIPVPQRGYWAKKEAGKPVKPRLLPPAPPGVNDRIRLTVHQPPPEPQTFPDLSPQPAIVVDPTPARLHPLVKIAAERLRKAEPDEHGAVRAAAGMMAVRIAPQSVGRAIPIMDALFKALEARGHKMHAEDRFGPAVSVLGVRVSLVLYETVRRSEHRETPEEKAVKEAKIRRIMKRDRISEISANMQLWERTRYDYFPSGELSLQIDGWVRSAPRRQWKDSPSRKLEERLGEAVVGIEQYAVCSKREDEERAVENARREEEARRREEERRRKEEEARRREELLAEAGAADRAGQIRRFVAAVRSAAPKQSPSVGEWADWALEVANAIDPVKIRLMKLLERKAEE